jgi:hypothetical protein
MPNHQRAEERKHHCALVKLGLKSDEVKTIRGITRDISNSGLGIYSITPFIEGQEVFADVGRSFTGKYKMMWGKEIAPALFSIGLSLIK